MCKLLLCFFVVITLVVIYPAIAFPYTPPIESITQYIIDLSRDIYNSIESPTESIIYNSRGEVKLKLLLSPWGELKDAYISESSGNEELDGLSLKAVWMYKKYQPFPESLGDEDQWIDVPVIFEARGKKEEIKAGDKDERPIGDGRNIKLKISGINEAVDIALENQGVLKIAEKEIELSKLKIRESRRALYPAASLNFLETTGKTTAETQDFTDKEYKVKFEQPLYYGWRLKYAVEQAVSNMKASRHNYDKVLQDLRFEVEAAFYSYIASKSNVRLQKSLLGEAEKISEVAKKRFDSGLTTRSEFFQVRSQLKQITYQVASSENDAAIARLGLTQAMNIDDTNGPEDLIDMNVNTDLEPLDIGMTLEECMDMAFRYRPDLKSKEYMVEFNDYERKIAKSKDQLKVDLTGSYGKSGGAFESETLTLAKDWYLGIKVSKPLGGNTLSTSYTKEETSEKHGETSRTESVSRAVEFGFLDNLKSFSEQKSSEIALRKARNDFQQTKQAVFKEVKEAYLNYKKGLVQTKASLNKIRYREEELKITKARAGLNEVPFSGLLEAHINLTDEKSFYIEAVGSLYQSLAKLNKATGYVLFLDGEDFMLARAGK